MSLINTLFGLLEDIENSSLEVHQNRCVVVRNRNSKCERCIESCPFSCISFSENELQIDLQSCTKCGMCASICPTKALEIIRPSDDELIKQCLLSMSATQGEVVIACDKILAAAKDLYNPEKVNSVSCLGRINESVLVALAASRALRITLVAAHCDECENKHANARYQEVCSTTRSILDAWNSNTRIETTRKFPAFVRKNSTNNYDHERRELFEGLRGDAAKIIVKATDRAIKEKLNIEEKRYPHYLKVTEKGTLPLFMPETKTRMLNSLNQLGKPKDVAIETSLWGCVFIDAELCSPCQMCAVFCPSGALSHFNDEDGVFGIQHQPAICLNCRCCVDLCQKNALTFSDRVSAVDIDSNSVYRFIMRENESPRIAIK